MYCYLDGTDEIMSFCSFCGKPQTEVKKMIAGPSQIFICNYCVGVCKTIIDRELGPAPQSEDFEF